MPDFEEIIAEADDAIAAIKKLQELIKLIEENFDKPARVELLAQIYYGWVDEEIEIVKTGHRMLKEQLDGSTKLCKAHLDENMSNPTQSEIHKP